MPASIVVTGIGANYATPGEFLEVSYAQGDAAGDSGATRVLLMGNKLSTGSATANTVIYGPDTPVQCVTETDVINLFGRKSELYRGWKKFTKVNKTTPLYLLAVAESAGTAATLQFVVANAATGNGVARIYIGDEFVDVTISSGDAAATIGANIVTAINSKLEWPVTAAGTTTVTVTASQLGPRGNWLRGMSWITPGIATTITNSTDTFFSGGATADSNATALSTILRKEFFYIVSAAEDATQVGALVTQVGTQALPATGILQNVIYGSTTTLAASITIATGINSPLSEMVWQKYSPLTPFELACNHAALVTLFEVFPNPRTNFINAGQTPLDQNLWSVKPSRDDSAAPTSADIESALNNGISPIATLTTGGTYLVDRISNKSLTGAVADYRARDKHKIVVSQKFGKDLKAKFALQHSGKRIASDPPDGAREPGANVITPKRAKGTVFSVINTYDENDLLDNAQLIKDGVVVQRESSPTTRLGIRVPLRVIDNHRQTVLAVDQVA
jgi:phage tail sheath gpL-like